MEHHGTCAVAGEKGLLTTGKNELDFETCIFESLLLSYVLDRLTEDNLRSLIGEAHRAVHCIHYDPKLIARQVNLKNPRQWSLLAFSWHL